MTSSSHPDKRRSHQIEPPAVLETLPALVIVVDSSGRSTYTNAKFHEYSGLPAEAPGGFDWLQVLHRGDRDRAAADLRDLIDRGDSYDAEYRLKRHDGRYRWHLCRAEPLRDSSRRVTGATSVCVDIEDRKRAQGRTERTRARAAGFDEHFTKPVDAAALSEWIGACASAGAREMQLEAVDATQRLPVR